MPPAVSRRIQAAGGIVWRRAANGLELAVVHRPRYDDWSLPKGKAEPGEHPVQTALREVAEETGQRTLVGRPLGASGYDVLVDGALTGKTVRWYAMAVVGDGPSTGDDVDDVRWVAPAAAKDLLTAGRDVDVVARFLTGPPDPELALLVRHAKAGHAGDVPARHDDLRPLVPDGEAQSRALAPVLAAFAPSRVLAAPVRRCEQTVAPLAALLQLAVESEPVLGEAHHARHPDVARTWVPAAAGRPSVVLCSQGGLIPDVVRALDPGQPDPAVRKASVWVLAFTKGRLLSADLLPAC